MIVHKILSSLKHFLSKDQLRAVLTGVHYNKKNDEFVATDGIMMAMIKLGKDNPDSDYPMTTNDSDLLEDIIIPLDILEDIKKLKKTTLDVTDQRALLRTYSDNVEQNHISLHTVTGGGKRNTSSVKAIDGMYPKYEAIMPDEHLFSFTSVSYTHLTLPTNREV